MKLGFLTAPFPGHAARGRGRLGRAPTFEVLEIACWPQSQRADVGVRRHGHIDVKNLSDAQASEIKAELANRRAAISGLGSYPNPLHPDPEHRAGGHRPPEGGHRCRRRMGIPLVNTFMGGDGAKHLDDNWEEALRVWPDIVAVRRRPGREDHARELPDALSATTSGRVAHNIARPPHIWRRILEQWGDTVGLNFDPSHLILQMIDIQRFLKEFGPHVLHYQAKDLMIDRDGLYERGIFSMGMGWQVPRIPGLGEVDWGVVHGELYRQGYEGDCIIEHEDRRFEGPTRRSNRASSSRVTSSGPTATDMTAAFSIESPLTERDIAKTIDHSLLRPELDDAFIEDGCRLAAEYDVASVCVRRSTSPAPSRSLTAPTSPSARSSVSPTVASRRTRRCSRRQALAEGATELDMVIQIGALTSGRDADVRADIGAIVDVAHAPGRSSRSSSRTPT